MPTCTPNIWASTRQWMGFIFWLGLSKRRREWADEHTAPANTTTTCNRPQRKIYNLTTDAHSFKCLFLKHAHQCPENYVHMICMHYITSTDGLNWFDTDTVVLCVFRTTWEFLLLKRLREASLSPSPASSRQGWRHHLSLCLLAETQTLSSLHNLSRDS